MFRFLWFSYSFFLKTYNIPEALVSRSLVDFSLNTRDVEGFRDRERCVCVPLGTLY